MSIDLLPGTPCLPDVLLHMCLQNMADVKGVIVLKVDKAGAVEIFTSQVSLHDLAYAALHLQSYAQDVVRGTPPDGTEFKPPVTA